MHTFDLNGRVAVVTGAAQGFGRAITERFLKSGAAVAMWDFDAAELDKTAKEVSSLGRVLPVRVDVSDLDAVNAATAETLGALKQIDILVGNAGIAGPNHKIWDYPIDEWRKVIEINLFGIYYTNRAVVPHMIERNYGRIINIASVAGKEGNPNASAYSASKAAVIAFTKSLGKELADKNIAANVVTPAAAKTRIFDQMTPEFHKFMLSKIPRGRFLQIEELASMVAWLASEENSFSTGSVFDISGGRSTY
ncbi:MAG: 3-oxoacyl-ACP reductase [Acidobacteria bacterium SCN 69-37]|nr:MAG: 3-oxoacyl-ACP reductase [Acidobacteria bacterium SCN 69-37]